MTAKYFAILTNYGAAQLANAVALGTKLNISVMAVGDGGGVLPIPNPAQTKLIRETRRAAVNQVSVDDKNPNYIISEQVIPENEGGWFIREIGLFDDKGGLIAVGNAPETYKPNLQEGSGRTQVIQRVLMVSSTESITLKVDPSVVLATREYVTKSIAAAIQESEARAAKTYQPKGDYVLHPYLKLEMLKKLDKSDVVNQLGNDTSKAASQALVATELGKKAPLNVADGKLAKDKNGADIPDTAKFIENLGLGEAAKSKVLQTTGTSKDNVMSQDGSTKAFMQIGAHGLGVRAVSDANIPSSTTGAGFYTVGNVGYEDIPPNSVLIRLQGDADRFIGCSTDGKGKLFFKDHASSQLFYLYHPGNVPPSFGISYKYKDEKNNRKNNTLYTNSTDETIFVSVSSMTTDVNGVLIGTMYVDGINVSRMATGGGGSMTLSKSVSVSAPVPARGTVRVVIENGDIGYWTEFKKS